MKRLLLICLSFLILLSGCGAPNSLSAGETTAVYDGVVVYASLSSAETLPPTEENQCHEEITVYRDLYTSMKKTPYIVEAELLGYHPVEDRLGVEDLAFRITKVYRGSFEEENEVIFVRGFKSEQFNLLEDRDAKIGQKFMLLMFKIQTADDGDYQLYGLNSSFFVTETDEKWELYHSKAERVVAELAGQ